MMETCMDIESRRKNVYGVTISLSKTLTAESKAQSIKNDQLMSTQARQREIINRTNDLEKEKITGRGLEPNEMIKELMNSWESTRIRIQVTSKDLIFAINSELAPKATTDQNTKFNALEQDVKERFILLNKQQVNQLTQRCTKPHDVNKNSRQKITRSCLYCRWNGHTFKYCGEKARDDDFWRQHTRANQERNTVFTQNYKKEE